MDRFEEKWEEFRERTIPHVQAPQALHALRTAYYSGALTMLLAVGNNGETPMTPEEATRYIDGLYKEVMEALELSPAP